MVSRSYRDPRTQRQPYSEAGATPRRQSRLSSRPAQQPEASTSASVPILDTRPLPAYRRRDADGGLGEKPAPNEQVRLSYCWPSLLVTKAFPNLMQVIPDICHHLCAASQAPANAISHNSGSSS